MPDELDDQIRAAMKVLDEQTPSGYFDAVPNQILARLEDGSMMQSGTTDMRDKRDLLTGPPVAAQEPSAAPKAERNDDSGLHDIRNLAQSTKQRLSSRRITQSPPIKDEDVLASSSGSWKNIALPQPAAMVSLPELEDLPSKQEVIAAQKAAAKARKAKATGDMAPALKQDVLAPNATANAALASLTAAPVAAAPAVSEAVPARQAFSLPSMDRQREKKSKAPLFAVVGLGLAAAAGAVFFMQSSKSEKKSSAATQTAMAEKEAAPAAAPAPAVKAEPIEAAAAGSAAEPTPPPAEEPKADEAAAGAVAAVADEGKAKHAGKAAPKKAATETETKEETKVEVKPEPTKTDKDKKDGSKDAKAGGGEGEPSFDALLKEAGVEEKKEAKPKLDKKSLSGDDFKHGMAAVNAKAQGCYKGTQGTATVKLTIAPSGAVTKASVGGQFAGTPEGACVEAAVKSATFPAWDGGPQSFNYSYMLSD